MARMRVHMVKEAASAAYAEGSLPSGAVIPDIACAKYRLRSGIWASTSCCIDNYSSLKPYESLGHILKTATVATTASRENVIALPIFP